MNSDFGNHFDPVIRLDVLVVVVVVVVTRLGNCVVFIPVELECNSRWHDPDGGQGLKSIRPGSNLV